MVLIFDSRHTHTHPVACDNSRTPTLVTRLLVLRQRCRVPKMQSALGNVHSLSNMAHLVLDQRCACVYSHVTCLCACMCHTCCHESYVPENTHIFACGVCVVCRFLQDPLLPNSACRNPCRNCCFLCLFLWLPLRISCLILCFLAALLRSSKVALE